MNYSQPGRPGAMDALRRPSNQLPNTRVGDTMATQTRYDSFWVRSSLSQLDFLRSARSVDAELGPVIDFAIRWAPFGGTESGDLLVSFGVGRHRFVEMMRAALRPRDSDDQEARWLKRRLLDALAPAWDADDRPSPGPVP